MRVVGVKKTQKGRWRQAIVGELQSKNMGYILLQIVPPSKFHCACMHFISRMSFNIKQISENCKKHIS